jgi:hypothetical protein
MTDYSCWKEIQTHDHSGPFGVERSPHDHDIGALLAFASLIGSDGVAVLCSKSGDDENPIVPTATEK